MGDIYRHDINLTDKQSITMFSKRSTPYNKAELARLLYMQGYKDQSTGLRVNTSSGSVVLYGTTGQNTDGAMTQKATTDALSALASSIPPPPMLYDSTGNNTNGAMTQKATTDALLDLASTIPDISVLTVVNSNWSGYKIKMGKFCIMFGKMDTTSTGVKQILFGETFSKIPIVLRTFQNGNAKYTDGIACGDLLTYNVTTTYFEYNQRYSNRGISSFLIAGVLV